MKRVLILIIIMVCLFFYPVQAKKLASLPEVGKPLYMAVDNGQIIITDLTISVHVYSLKDFKYQFRLSRRGEGPGEYLIPPLLYTDPGYIYLFSINKGIFFSRTGKLIREVKTPSKTIMMAPVGKNFICRIEKYNERTQNYYNDFSIYTPSKEDLEYKTMMFYYEYPPRQMRGGKWDYNMVREFKDFVIYQDNVFIGDAGRGLFVETFDSSGNKINRIHLKAEKLKVTEEYKKNYMSLLETDPTYQAVGSQYNLIFPEYFPGFYRFSVNDGKVYFLTYKKMGKSREVIVTDLKGKELKRTSVPWIENEISINYSIDNGKFYYLEENEETEEWELHMVEIG
jgi:hypothetical protein